ncbi:histidine phosphatase superfamily-domain-containing protein [Dimargaris cristalligena]|uniref:Inositol hexakisphosphate and diphosphoinositol-pentakisphosphate kinase n=1 Tax=Dimargaris cristalligena TaxID=215637 RepID=A0A4V1J432_9FUNG|nr:histidine phosphatase superfamily-domain-containing protein [Dimargaris cristalligena]|eukprot:RKP34149.1 histidine phosphatase superfamily-domain-containing protein [Dimargaris cristalligena]
MISFFSKGFPLRKAIAYQKLRGVFSVNNLPLQELLWDRRLVMEVLGRIGVHTPPRWTVSRDGGPFVSDDVAAILKNRMGVRLKRTEKPPVVHHIDEDTISINGEIIRKPFVEKPVSGEDHNIYIYFSTEQGGGVRKLFRKVGNKSSEYFPDLWEIRKEGSFIYEDFMDVDNAEDDLHAETRKSPVVDGIVKRNADGKEVRYETELTPEEKRFARKVSMSFGQAVCGIDFLRVDGTSYVIDVNGWSFVKGCSEYYEVCSQYLHDIFLQAAERRWFSMYLWKKPSYDDQWTLKGFLSVFRHADRTPKQKIKYGFTSEPFVALLKGTHQEVILRKETDLAQVLKAAETAQEANLEDEDKLEQLQSILSRKMGMEGTKVQLKPSYSKVTGALVKLQVILKWGGGCTHAGIHHTRELADNMRKDLIILNKRILDDVVVYSSSEQRVIATAKVFCERLLNCTHLPSDFLIIRKDMLDDSNAAKEEMDHVKSRLKAFFKAHEANLEVSKGFDLPDEMEDPQTFVRGVYDLLTRVTRNMRKNLESPQVQNAILKNYYWCCNENVALFRERWEKLLQDFGKVEKNKFDPGKVGELYDSLKYDALHNRKLMDRIFVSPDGTGGHTPESIRELYHKAKLLFDFVTPREYGIDESEKLEIGVLTSVPLLKQIISDLRQMTQQDYPGCRLYFTKESHIHTLLNCVFLSGLPTNFSVYQAGELDFLTQITFEVYERKRDHQGLEPEYSLRLGFSPGAYYSNVDSNHALAAAARRDLTDHIELNKALGYFQTMLDDTEKRDRGSGPRLTNRLDPDVAKS